jgi:hypothetical protein
MALTAAEAQRISDLETRTADLESAVGDDYKHPRLDDASWLARGHPAELTSGDYNLFYRIREIGRDQDSLNRAFVKLADAVAGGGTGATAAEQLAALNIHVLRNKLSVGMLPILDSKSAIDIGGEASAVILGGSNMNADHSPAHTDGQNPGEVHINGIVVADNDGGLRWWQYAYWNKLGQKVRNTNPADPRYNRPNTTVALDSYGDLCISDDRVSWGQVFYLVKRISAGFVDLCTFRTDFKIRLRQSSVKPGHEADPESFDKGYGACDVDVIEQAVEAALAKRGL